MLGYHINKYIFIGCVFVGQLWSSPIPETNAIPLSQPLYYNRLKQNEFMLMMMPKEKLLLGIIRCVSDEIASRSKEGINISELGFTEDISIQETKTDELVLEYESLIGLLGEIDKLQNQAKQKADFQSLKNLSNLRKKISEVTSHSLSIPNNMEQDSTFENKGIDQETLNLIDEVAYVRFLEFKQKMTAYQIYRTRLIATAKDNQLQRMFQKDLIRSLKSYSEGDFSLSRLQLRDILFTYKKIHIQDDVLYYAAESSYGLNLFDEALVSYQQLIDQYPQSSFRSKAIEKMIFIYYVLGQTGRMDEKYKLLINKPDSLTSIGTVSYLVGYVHFKADDFIQAIQILKRVENQSIYYFPTLYLIAACHSNLGHDSEAISIFQKLISYGANNNPILLQIQNNSLLKLGMIYNNQGQYDLAKEYFDRVSNDSEHYDLSLIGKAWNAYSSGRPIETLQNTEVLLRFSMSSRYAYEARVLAARAKELLGKYEEATDDFKRIYESKKSAPSIEKNKGKNISSQRLTNMYEEEKMLINEQEKQILSEINEIRSFLFQNQKSSDVDTIQYLKLDVLDQNIVKLDSLEDLAKDQHQPELIEKIRRLRADMILTERNQLIQSDSADIQEDPFLRRMGMTDYLKYLFYTLLNETQKEKGKASLDIANADNLIERANSNNQSDLLFRIELRKEELEDYYCRLNQYEVWLREHKPQEVQLELDKWAIYSGYSISNIGFSRIKETDQKIADLSKTIDKLLKIYRIKRDRLDLRINNLLSDVEKIEDQMKHESADKEVKEKERLFNTNYFDRQIREAPAGELKEKPEPNTGRSQ